MLNSKNAYVNGIEIDKTKADEILRWLILAEKKNIKSKEKNDQQMIRAIQKKIEEVTKCY